MIISVHEKIAYEMVDRVPADISLEEFQEHYLVLNKPCIFSNVATAQWQCRRQWIANGRPNFAFLRAEFGTVDLFNMFKLIKLYSVGIVCYG